MSDWNVKTNTDTLTFKILILVYQKLKTVYLCGK